MKNIASLVLYKDDNIIVLNKPAGIAVNKGRGKGKNIEQFLQELCFEYKEIPAPAHRLDRDTSGCLILGRHKKAVRQLGKFFMSRSITKTYLAVVHGKIYLKAGQINAPILKQSAQKHNWWVKISPEGQEAITDYKVLGNKDNYTLLSLSPRTGRTHQIRVHCQHIGNPILGDKIYGNDDGLPNLQLHAHSVIIPRQDKTPIHITAPIPGHMTEYTNYLEIKPDTGINTV